MLRKAEELKRFTLGAKDGNIGRIDDFYFDDYHPGLFTTFLRKRKKHCVIPGVS